MLGTLPLGTFPLGAGSSGEGGSYAYKDLIESGVVYPSYGRTAAWSSTTDWEADFPVANLASIDELRRVALASDVGVADLTFLLPAAQIIDTIAFIHHNAPEGATYRIRLSAGVDPLVDVIYDTGLLPFWPTGKDTDLYSTMRPHKIPTAISARSGRIDFSSNPEPWEIGAIEIGSFWAWPDVQFDRSIGIGTNAVTIEAAGAADHISGLWSPRTAAGNRGRVDQDELDVTLMDFHRATGRNRAFVWCWNINDPASWTREAFMARNRTLPAPIITDYEIGTMTYDFEEHLP